MEKKDISNPTGSQLQELEEDNTMKTNCLRHKISVILTIVIWTNFSFSQVKTGVDYYSDGTGFFQKEDYIGALKSYNKAIEILTKTNEAPFILAECYSMKAVCKTQLDDFRGAIEDYTIAADLYYKISPNSSAYVSSIYQRGVCKLLLNDLNGACKDWSKSGELGQKESYEKIRQYCN